MNKLELSNRAEDSMSHPACMAQFQIYEIVFTKERLVVAGMSKLSGALKKNCL